MKKSSKKVGLLREETTSIMADRVSAQIIKMDPRVEGATKGIAIAIGLNSMDLAELRKLDKNHSIEQALASAETLALQIAKETGFAADHTFFAKTKSKPYSKPWFAARILRWVLATRQHLAAGNGRGCIYAAMRFQRFLDLFEFRFRVEALAMSGVKLKESGACSWNSKKPLIAERNAGWREAASELHRRNPGLTKRAIALNLHKLQKGARLYSLKTIQRAIEGFDVTN